jgi:predicted DNA-binding protein with PD1-like motif
MARIYKLDKGASLVDEILMIANREGIKTAGVEAIGAVSRATIAYFNQDDKKYEEHEYTERMELTSMLGNITMKEGKPILHAHCTFARRDMSVIGGHLVSAKVSPLVELVITPTENRATRKFNEEIGLNVIYRIEG